MGLKSIAKKIKKAAKKGFGKVGGNIFNGMMDVVTLGAYSNPDIAAKVGAAAGLGALGGYGATSLLGGAGAGASSAAGAAGAAKAAGAGARTMGTNFNWGSVIGGGLSGLGGIGSSALSANAAAKAQKQQIAWERERAQNAHQWEVMDLINAGLNPILSAGGQGAATGGISAPMPDFSGIANAGQNMFNTMLTAQQTKNAEAERDNINADTDLKTMQALETIANTRWLGAKEKETVANTAQSYAHTMLLDQQYKQQDQRFQKELELLEKQIQSAQLQNDERKVAIALKQYENKMKQYSWWLNQMNEAGRTGAALLMGLSSGAKTAASLIPATKAIGFLAK